MRIKTTTDSYVRQKPCQFYWHGLLHITIETPEAGKNAYREVNGASGGPQTLDLADETAFGSETTVAIDAFFYCDPTFRVRKSAYVPIIGVDPEAASAWGRVAASLMAKTNRNYESDTAVQERIKTQKPKMYRVILLNDDFTTMEFVVQILETIFLKSPSEAMQIMLQVHKSGKGTAGIFSKQIAEAKIDQVHQRARSEGFPLRCTMEEV